MNARDSEKLSGVLSSLGYEEIEDEQLADIVIFNTCTVRENANDRLYGRIGHLKSSCINNKEKIVGICGCMMQEPDEVKKIIEKYPYVKLIFGTHNINDFQNLIKKVIENGKRLVSVYNSYNEYKDACESTNDNLELSIDKKVFGFKCGVNIMYGCNNFCTYCIVPYVRGREHSRNSSDIINEIKDDIKKGIVEVMLLGQNVNSYAGDVSFPELLDKVAKIDGLLRVRFMTSHPKDLSKDLIDVIKNNKNICRHIHLPAQSGSDRILSLMNRHYDRKKYLDVVKLIRENIEDVSITTDIIVGFPGETEEDFNDTLKLIEGVKFDQVFTFEYSKRTGTKAAEMPDQIPESVVKTRFNKLLKVVEKTASVNAEKYVGRTMEVLVEGFDETSRKLTGRTSNNYLVHFNGNKSSIGNLVNVTLSKSHGFYFDGDLYN